MESKESILYHLGHLKQLIFEVTDICNLKCRYCGLSQLYEGNEKRNRKKLSFKKARLIIDYLFSLRAASPGANYPLTISFYGGEPLLNMNLIKQIISYLNKPCFPKVDYNMTTNAMLLDKYMDFLAEKRILLVISLDGDETSQSYRQDHSGKNSFHRVFKNINLLQEKYPEYFQKYVQFNSVLHNMNNVETTYRFIKDHFGKTPLIASLNTSRIHSDKIQEFKEMYQNVADNIMRSENCEALEAEMFIHTPKILQLTQYIFKHSGNVFNDFNDLIFDISRTSTDQTGTCPPFAKKMFITVEGKILQCERIAHHFALGKISNKSVDLDVEFIANTQNQYVLKLKRQCDKCYFKQECPQCVYNIDEICTNRPKCNLFMDENNYNQFKKSMVGHLRQHPNYYEKIFNEVTVRY